MIKNWIKKIVDRSVREGLYEFNIRYEITEKFEQLGANLTEHTSHTEYLFKKRREDLDDCFNRLTILTNEVRGLLAQYRGVLNKPQCFKQEKNEKNT